MSGVYKVFIIVYIDTLKQPITLHYGLEKPYFEIQKWKVAELGVVFCFKSETALSTDFGLVCIYTKVVFVTYLRPNRQPSVCDLTENYGDYGTVGQVS